MLSQPKLKMWDYLTSGKFFIQSFHPDLLILRISLRSLMRWFPVAFLILCRWHWSSSAFRNNFSFPGQEGALTSIRSQRGPLVLDKRGFPNSGKHSVARASSVVYWVYRCWITWKRDWHECRRGCLRHVTAHYTLNQFGYLANLKCNSSKVNEVWMLYFQHFKIQLL